MSEPYHEWKSCEFYGHAFDYGVCIHCGEPEDLNDYCLDCGTIGPHLCPASLPNEDEHEDSDKN